MKNNRLIYRCKKYKKEWKGPTNKLVEKFPGIYQFCNGNFKKFVFPIRKSIYPYEYKDSWEKFDETLLPSKEEEDFYSELNLEGICHEDYLHAQKAWEVFEIKNLGEHHDLFAQRDMLLPEDVFEHFRNMCLDIYGLDPI